MILLETTDSNKLSRISNIDSLLDIQWWLYKSLLSRQPVEVKYYRDWFNMYKKSCSIVEQLESENIEFFVAVKEYKQLINKLSEAKNSVMNILPSDCRNYFDDIVKRLKSGIENIINILEENNDQ